MYVKRARSGSDGASTVASASGSLNLAAGFQLIAPVRGSGHRLRLPRHRSNRAGRRVAGRTIRGVLDWPIVGNLRSRSGRQRRCRRRWRCRSTGHGVSRRQRTETSTVGTTTRTTSRRWQTRERHHARHAHAVAADTIAEARTVAAIAATGPERTAAVAKDRAAADRTEGIVLAHAELGATAATAASLGEQAETTSGKRGGRHDARDDQSQHSREEQFFHDGGVRECSTGGAGQHP